VAHRGRRNADDNLAAALAAGRTLREAAEAVGVSERTATRRAAEPGFRRRVTELRAAMVQGALGRLSDAMAEAADTLRRLLRAKRESARLGAARAIYEIGCKLRETVDLEERIAALENNNKEPAKEDLNGSPNRWANRGRKPSG
jgi:hypothetical protein